MELKVARTIIKKTENIFDLNDDDLESIIIEHFRHRFPQGEIEVIFGSGQLPSAVVTWKTTSIEDNSL